jgi:hypothetical protein
MPVPEALHGTGEAFLEAERELLAQGQAAVPALEAELESADPVRRLTAQAMLDRLRGAVSADDVEAFFRSAEQAAAESIVLKPPATAAAAGLERAFGEAAAPLIATHLVKLGEQWPAWQTRAAAIYAAKSSAPGTNEALARFASGVAGDQLRADVLDALVAYGGPTVATALRAELDRTGPPERHANARPALEAALQQIGSVPA